jgi:FixJ family two-component response regulator
MTEIGPAVEMNSKHESPESPLVSIVDDDVSVRRSTLRLLNSSGLRAEAFASAEAFLQSRRVAETGCLLLDVRMPGMDGLELQRRLSESGSLVPIIFLSARASEGEERRAMNVGAAHFLRKPVGKDALLNAIHSALRVPAKPGKHP